MAEILFNSWGKEVPPAFGAGGKRVRALVGWGGLALLDPGVNPIALFRAYLELVQEKSCGRCVPCRLGSKVMLDIMRRLAAGRGQEDDIVQLERLGVLARDGSLCEFGQSFPLPLLDYLRERGEELSKYIRKPGPLPGGAYRFLGAMTAPCLNRCPAHLDVPRYVQDIAEGNLEAALGAIREKTFLGGVLGRVCANHCESNCRRNGLDEPVNIRCLKRFAADSKLARRRGSLPVEAREEKVAVVGSGPAGLSAAYQLARLGYSITVFEARQSAGGMLALAIPAYRLPQEVLEREIGLLKEMGVEFRLGMALGREITLEGLKGEGYRAILLATGLPQSASLGIDGEGLAGVLPGLDYLEKVKAGQPVEVCARVAVVGSGHLALDCARTALRLGSREVYLICGKKRASLASIERELAEAEAEGVKVYPGAEPLRILGRNGRVEALEMRDSEAGAAKVLEIEAVLAAAGRQADLNFLPGKVGLQVNPVTMETGIPGVFAAGDITPLGGSVVKAVASGNRAAACMHSYLREGQAGVEEEDEIQDYLDALGVYDPAEKVSAPGGARREGEAELPAAQRARGFEETREGLAHQAALREAGRCLRCYRPLLIVI